MKVLYYYDQKLLAQALYSRIEQILIPDFRPDSHDVYIKKSFENQDAQNWKIEKLEFHECKIELHLSPVKVLAVSISKFAKDQKKWPSTILFQHCIVEVDFGYQSKILDIDGSSQPNDQYTSTILRGEIHKKRPCVVYRVEKELVEVIPLTTKSDNQKADSVVELGFDSFKNLSQKYKKQRIYALTDMIQVVSTKRVYSPLDKDGKYRHKYSGYKLTSGDQRQIESALAEKYSKKIYDENKKMEFRLKNLEAEKSRLFKSNKKLDEKIDKDSHYVSELEQEITGIAEFFDIDTKLNIVQIREELLNALRPSK